MAGQEPYCRYRSATRNVEPKLPYFRAICTDLTRGAMRRWYKDRAEVVRSSCSIDNGWLFGLRIWLLPFERTLGLGRV